MKKIYLLSAFIVGGLFAQAQTLPVQLSSSEVCAGESVTAHIKGPEMNLVSSGVDDNQHNGVMFDIVGVEGAIIKGFNFNVRTANSSMEVYYRLGSYVSFENSNTGWILLGSSTGVPSGNGVNTGIELDLPILPGQTLGFYVTCTGLTEYVGYGTGIAVGTDLGTDPYLKLLSGVGKVYPFAATNTPRDFVGSVIYEPILTDITWDNSTSTVDSATVTLNRSGVISAKATFGGAESVFASIVKVNEYDVEGTATPPVLAWGQSSTLTVETTLSTGLGTTYEAGNGLDGAMFDVTATKALSVQGFSLRAEASAPVDVEIYFKTGTLVGFEGNAAAWTGLGTYSLDTGLNAYVQLSAPLALAPAQTVAFYITRTDGNSMKYTDGTLLGSVFSSDANLSIKEGKGVNYPFASNYSPRVLNCIVHYKVVNPVGISYSWSDGLGSGSSAIVTPNGDRTYTVTVDDGSCEATTDVSVTMALGIGDDLSQSIGVYPNPATNVLTVRSEDVIDLQQLTLMDASGKTVFTSQSNATFSAITMDVSTLARGMYILQMNVDGHLYNRKVVLN